jgi:hypothetical protein
MRGERAEFLERAFVEEQREPLARRELAARMLLLNAFLPTAEHGAAAHLRSVVRWSPVVSVIAAPPVALAYLQHTERPVLISVMRPGQNHKHNPRDTGNREPGPASPDQGQRGLVCKKARPPRTRKPLFY